MGQTFVISQSGTQRFSTVMLDMVVRLHWRDRPEQKGATTISSTTLPRAVALFYAKVHHHKLLDA